MLLLTFTAGPNRYAVDVVRVVEVVPRVNLRPIPHAPSFLAGLLGYRGKVVPVIDLSSLLGAPPCRDRLSTRIILVNTAPGDQNGEKITRDNVPASSPPGVFDRGRSVDLLGLVAEHVSELTNAQPEQTVPLPVALPQAPYLDAVVQTDEGIVQLIMVERLRDTILRQAVYPQGALPPEPSPEPVNPASETQETGS
jgi:chemotaxis-related protein WspB